MPGRLLGFVARYRAEVLRATYSLESKDSVVGGMAVHGFVEMHGLKCGLAPRGASDGGSDAPVPQP